MKFTNILRKWQKVAFAVFKYFFLEFHVSKSNTKCTVLEASWVPPWEENLGKLCKYDVIYKIFLICTVLLVITRGDKFGKICKFYISDLHFDQCRGLSRTKYQTGEVWITCFFSSCWPEAQKPKTLWVATFHAQKLSRRSARKSSSQQAQKGRNSRSRHSHKVRNHFLLFSSKNLKYSQIFLIWNNSGPRKWEQRYSFFQFLNFQFT